MLPGKDGLVDAVSYGRNRTGAASHGISKPLGLERAEPHQRLESAELVVLAAGQEDVVIGKGKQDQANVKWFFFFVTLAQKVGENVVRRRRRLLLIDRVTHVGRTFGETCWMLLEKETCSRY